MKEKDNKIIEKKKIGIIGSIIVVVTVFLFAIFMACRLNFWSYLICMILPIGFLMMIVSLKTDDKPIFSNLAFAFAIIYLVFIFIVYFTQNTILPYMKLSEELSKLLDFQKGGLLFSFDLLGYGFMALSTFFIGLTINANNKRNKVLKWMLLLHGIFFVPCFILPMTGTFLKNNDPVAGIIVLEFWCAYFIPVGVLSALYFKEIK